MGIEIHISLLLVHPTFLEAVEHIRYSWHIPYFMMLRKPLKHQLSGGLLTWNHESALLHVLTSTNVIAGVKIF